MGSDMCMNYYEIGQRIRRYRKARGLSQEQLAEKIWISPTHMSHIETGSTKLSLPVFVDLAAALGVQTDELLSDNVSGFDTACQEINEVINACTPRQLRILAEIIKASKAALDKYDSQ